MLIICPYPIGVAAGQRLKYEQYFDKWNKDGWDITISPYMNSSMWEVIHKRGFTLKKIKGVLRGHSNRLKDLISIPKYDLIYIFMYVTPFFSSFMERIVRKLSKRLVYDIEDNIYIQKNNRAQFDPNPIAKYLKWQGKVDYLIKKADHVITSSPFLNNYCLKLNKYNSCTYISSSLDTDRFQPKNKYKENKKITIGWTGTFSSKNYLDSLRNVFLNLSKKVDFKLRVIGNFQYSLPGVDLEVINWTLDNEIIDLQEIDIGVYPLPLNDWVLGKSGLKAIQYMALGIPCVATEVGTTPMLIKNNFNGLLVKKEEEWISALERLILDRKSRERMGRQARIDAVSNYSLNAIGNLYDNVINDVMKRPK